MESGRPNDGARAIGSDVFFVGAVMRDESVAARGDGEVEGAAEGAVAGPEEDQAGFGGEAL